MISDRGLTEWAEIEETGLPSRAVPPRAVPPRVGPGRLIHRYGRLSILAASDEEAASLSLPGPDEPLETPGGLSEVERLGLAALRSRASAEFRAAKDSRPRDGERWDMPDCVVPRPAELEDAVSEQAGAGGGTSDRLEGSVAVGLIFVGGATEDLRFSDEERIKILAEVQSGLGRLAMANPGAAVSFVHDVQDLVLDVAPDPGTWDLEGLWRDPAMARLGYSGDWAGVVAYVHALRNLTRARWSYCAFFTKYPIFHFSYAYPGGPHLVMDPRNGDWGPDNIDSVFAHGTAHIFQSVDEYASSGCVCGGRYGRLGVPNGNCENCSGGARSACLMRSNHLGLCAYTRGQLGWPPALVLGDFGDHQGWQADRHPRFLADLTGNGRADIVGFGDEGVQVSLSTGYQGGAAPQFTEAGIGLADFGTRHGWLADRHPRFLAELTRNGRRDIVGFGQDGTYVARSRGDGTFDPAVLVVAGFGDDQGWRVDRHPRFLADVTGNGKPDIVGFGNEGVWVSLSRGDGTFNPPRLGRSDFGTDQGWQVDRHPRFLADLAGNGKYDIVGFSKDGTYLARSNGDGTFNIRSLAITNFGTDQGWQVDRHPRFLADVTGDGYPDIVGFGDEGVWVSLNRGGYFEQPRLGLSNFGYEQGWRVGHHPRLLIDLTGDGKADIVGFGRSGTYVSRSRGDGTFDPPALVLDDFGYEQGWRVTSHLRLVADVTGDRRPSIVGFRDQGVWVAAGRADGGFRMPEPVAEVETHPALR